MIDVLFLTVVILHVVLHVLKSHVQDPQNALDRVQLRQGQQLDLWRYLAGCG